MTRAATIPSSPTPGPFDAALNALRTELERHRRDAVETEALLVRLERFAANGSAPPQPSPPVAGNGRRRHDGTPDDAARRAKKALLMRQRRERIWTAKAAAAAKPAKPKPKARKKANSTAPSADKASEPATDTPPPEATPGAAAKRNGRPPSPFMSGVKGTLTEWKADADGTLSRELVAPGERTPLRDEALVAPRS